MRNINWDIVVPVLLGVVILGVGIWAIVNHVGMNAVDGLRVTQYTLGITLAP